jgi:hypothetical protein
MARGLGEHNVQILILTPDGRLLSALAGYVGPAALLEELQMGQLLWDEVRAAPEADCGKLLEKAHTAFARQLSERKGADGLVGKQEEFFGQLKAVGNRRGVADHEFSARHPLLPADKFTTGLMVGTAKTAFVAQTSGSEDALKLLQLLPRPALPKRK